MRRGVGQAGTTLVELLVAIALLGITVTAVLTAMATSTQTTRVPVQQADLDAYLRNWAEVVANQAPTGCALPAVTVPAGLPVGYSAPAVPAPTYWNGSAWTASCTTGSTAPQRWVLSLQTGLASDVHSSSLSVQVTRYSRVAP